MANGPEHRGCVFRLAQCFPGRPLKSILNLRVEVETLCVCWRVSVHRPSSCGCFLLSWGRFTAAGPGNLSGAAQRPSACLSSLFSFALRTRCPLLMVCYCVLFSHQRRGLEKTRLKICCGFPVCTFSFIKAAFTLRMKYIPVSLLSNRGLRYYHSSFCHQGR